MAVTPHTSGTIPIRGKSYTLPQSFTAQHGKDGKTDSEGNGGADGLTAGKTYYITQYATIKGTDTLTSWPYAISPTSKNEPLGWWQADLFPVATYTIKYRANYSGGTNPDDQTKTWGTPLTLRSAMTRTGYTFGGWNTNNSGTGTNYAAGASYKSDSAVTLYAKWTANTYTVKYNANGGTGSMSNSSHSYDAAKNLTANAFTRTGYRFIGWSKSADGDVEYDDQASVTNLTSTKGGTVNLYAQWTARTYRVILHGQGGKIENSQSVQYNAYFDGPVGGLNYGLSLPVPTRAGYNFIGWNDKDDGNGNYYIGSEIMNVVGGMVLYAIWEPAASLVTIQINGQPRRGMMHMYDDNGQLCYAIMTIYDEDGNGYYTC